VLMPGGNGSGHLLKGDSGILLSFRRCDQIFLLRVSWVLGSFAFICCSRLEATDTNILGLL
jgi:hypothetical protein